MRTLRRGVVLVLAAATLAAGCSSDDGDTATDQSTEDAGAPDTESTDGGSTDDGSTGGAPVGEPVGVYGDMANWMCHPDLDAADNVCLRDLDVTVVQADGTTEVVEHEVAEDPAIDCFYVYPTISADAGASSDLVPGEGEEVRAVLNQAARLNSTCEVFAPVYRQIPLGALFGGGEGTDREAAREQAYQDVKDAWETYLAQAEPGRGVVLVGHSQGSGHLNRLIAEEIDGDDELRGRLVSALLLGSSVAVPEGELVGGDFEEVPLCTEDGEIGCVVTYATFRSTAPPPDDSFFGRPREGDGVAGCVNPAALAGGSAELDNVFPSDSGAWADPAGQPEITTPFLSLPGMLEGECVAEGGFNYLEVTVNGDPTDPRIDDIGGDLTPEWGLHLVDANVAMGDLVALVAAQAAAYDES